MSNLLTLAMIVFSALILYRFRNHILGPLRRFEARNVARRADEIRALYDRNAHYRQTVGIAEEQVEEVATIRVNDERTGRPVERYLFQGAQYATREEANAARLAAVIEKAREFYVDLDRNWLARRRSRDPGASSLPDPSKHEKFTPPRQ